MRDDHRTYERAVTAITKVDRLGHQRATTATDAVGAVLVWLGAGRVMAAINDPNTIADRRIIDLLRDVEVAAGRLADTPWRAEFSEERARLWRTVRYLLGGVRVLMDESRSAIDVRSVAA